ncbi:MAG: UDP-N-acetylmuramoyl-L-alanine--D-glutamate ligase [Candidatus Sungbacteria bacterium]|uniref:UDP-N-acetylmuramoylalanine--D-glutamate ligase n=1 Tax=Candidatus Sungiibacteriota bacterium TaxID=2750080 RepID=A0A933DRR0_9BACT|nr:UDP-N-acetylmuramoyl-L-alanine--D-glutamate ligase [Candidatus Sungbacteria bacterium]
MQPADFKNKKVLIMGLGLHGGGGGAAEFFAKLGSRVTVTDLKSRRELAPSLARIKRWKNIAYHLGSHRAKDFQTHDYVIKNPGVPDNSRFLKVAKRARVPVLSDVEIFFLASPAPIIGITGTKGKSTATWLLGEFLKHGLRRRIWVGGNIRCSALEFLPRVQKGDWVVLELSSFQLDSLKSSRRSPQIAVITNIFPDHFNRYPSMRSYIASKAGIFKYQRPTDSLFISSRDKLLNRLSQHARSRVVRFDPQKTTKPFLKSLSAVIPPYHVPNIAAAIAVARHVGVGESAIRKVLSRFRGIPGRMELVRNVRGIEFINDTTATNPTAAEEAVKAVKRRIGTHGLFVIAGGYDKGLPVRDFARALRRHTATIVFLPGGASEKMKSQIPKSKFQTNLKFKIPKLFNAKSMPQAVRIAYREAKSGDVVLLSPGAASFGLFQHEFDRGDQFVRAVELLSPAKSRI